MSVYTDESPQSWMCRPDPVSKLLFDGSKSALSLTV